MIVDDGVVIGAWGDITRKFECHSMRKSLLSALIGIHVEGGHIDMSKTIKELGIDDKEPSLTATEKQATVADLIKARSAANESSAIATLASIRDAQEQFRSAAIHDRNGDDDGEYGFISDLLHPERGERLQVRLYACATARIRSCYSKDALHTLYDIIIRSKEPSLRRSSQRRLTILQPAHPARQRRSLAWACQIVSVHQPCLCIPALFPDHRPLFR